VVPRSYDLTFVPVGGGFLFKEKEVNMNSSIMVDPVVRFVVFHCLLALLPAGKFSLPVVC
jgi:hypothetical protein